MTRSAVSYRGRLDSLIIRGEKAPAASDIEALSHWARYLCVLTSGFIEVSISEACLEYARANRTDKRVLSYVSKQFDRFQNPNMSRIIQLMSSFDPKWGEQIEVAARGQVKDAVDSVVANRNNIAHGTPVGITVVRIRDYYRDVCKLTDLIDRLCGL